MARLPWRTGNRLLIDFNSLTLAPCIAVFGQPVVYQPAAGAPIALTGIFNAVATEDKISGDGQVVQVVTPTLAINAADLPAGAPLPVRNELVQVNGTLWQIAEPVADNFGQLLLKLKRVTQ